MSGSSSALLRRRPLRTVRASFPAYGSSLNKFNRRVEPVAHLFFLVHVPLNVTARMQHFQILKLVTSAQMLLVLMVNVPACFHSN